MKQLGALDEKARNQSKRRSCQEATALGRPTATGRPNTTGRPTPGVFTSQIDYNRSTIQRPDDRHMPDV